VAQRKERLILTSLFVLDIMSHLLGIEHCINATVIITLGIDTNIGTNSLRMPRM
jgi:hypothetical protein